MGVIIWNDSKLQWRIFFREIDLFDFTSFFGPDFLKFTSTLCCNCNKNFVKLPILTCNGWFKILSKVSVWLASTEARTTAWGVDSNILTASGVDRNLVISSSNCSNLVSVRKEKDNLKGEQNFCFLTFLKVTDLSSWNR